MTCSVLAPQADRVYTTAETTPLIASFSISGSSGSGSGMMVIVCSIDDLIVGEPAWLSPAQTQHAREKGPLSCLPADVETGRHRITVTLSLMPQHIDAPQDIAGSEFESVECTVSGHCTSRLV